MDMDNAEKKIEKIILELKKTKGLKYPRLIPKAIKESMINIEEERNIGVKEALKRRYSIAVIHDSYFREPAGEIIIERESETIFPGVPFPEVDAKNVVSGSPGLRLHRFLLESIFNQEKIKDEDASLIIGFEFD